MLLERPHAKSLRCGPVWSAIGPCHPRRLPHGPGSAGRGGMPKLEDSRAKALVEGHCRSRGSAGCRGGALDDLHGCRTRRQVPGAANKGCRHSSVTSKSWPRRSPALDEAIRRMLAGGGGGGGGGGPLKPMVWPRGAGRVTGKGGLHFHVPGRRKDWSSAAEISGRLVVAQHIGRKRFRQRPLPGGPSIMVRRDCAPTRLGPLVAHACHDRRRTPRSRAGDSSLSACGKHHPGGLGIGGETAMQRHWRRSRKPKRPSHGVV